MKITNIGEKIVGVGSVILMPGDSGNFNETVAEAPSIKNLVSLGYLKVEEEPKPVKEAPKKKPVKNIEVEELDEVETVTTVVEADGDKEETTVTAKVPAKRTRAKKSS